MLLELDINDFAIIDRLHITLQRGFTTLTGETGAGKSIIIDALGTLRGNKVTADFVRAGSTRARIEGIFSLADCPDLIPVLQEYGLWNEEDEQVILSREISAESGRSVARINRRAVNTTILRDVGGRLIDIHGQHEGLSIFNTRTHIDMLDRYGSLLDIREQVGALGAQLRRLREEIADLKRSESQRSERIEELRMLLEDVQTANLYPEEEQELVQERSVLHNVARIAELVQHALRLLSKSDESMHYTHKPIIDAMADVDSDINDLARLDPAAVPLAEQATDLRYRLEDLVSSIRDYSDKLDFEPDRLDTIEDRLTHIRSLQRKYSGDVAHILYRAEHAEAEIEHLSHSDEYRAELEAREAALLAELGTHAGELSQRRRAIGDELAHAIESAMDDLAMPHVRFEVQVTQVADPLGVLVDLDPNNKQPATHYHLTATGIDRVEFLLSPNPGEPLKPLVRIASGGESARLFLALKSILSRVDMVPTLIFDEVDVGVGGRAGQVIGQKLWSISEIHQVICITHLPQVAAFADTHYAIQKEIGKSSSSGELYTRTSMRCLNLDERIEELAAMLDGTPVSHHSCASAREMIERAHAMKEMSSCNERQK